MNRKIEVNTIPNGYTLSVGNEEYMYFNEESLLRGIMFHIGLGEREVMDTTTADEFISASVLWKDNKKTVKELLKVQKENQALTRSLKSQKDVVKRLTKKLNRIAEEEK